MHPRFVAVTLALPLLGACTTTALKSAQLPPLARVSRDLKLARRATLPAEQRAGYYLDAAALTSRDPDNLRSTAIYNDATAELTDLLRRADGGQLWNRPLETSANGTLYRLHFTRPA